MKRRRRIGLWIVFALAAAGIVAGAIWTRKAAGRRTADAGQAYYAGSRSCKQCHERFYNLWEPSHHGKAMQPVTEEFVKAELAPQDEPILIGDTRYLAEIDERRVVGEGPAGRRVYRMVHALGGKNIYYFLTPLERGRLQVMPVAFDVRERTWIDTTASMVRHFAEGDEALDWTDPLLTFNTACYNCHVSQLSKNYDLETDTYRTVWKEPGINCEACHGPASEHNRVCLAAPEGTVPDDIKIPRVMTDFTARQRDDICAPCHAKMSPLTTSFMPGDRYFDHYDLVTFENRDFYPDGRDLGENYTYTLWLMSPCVKAGKLECHHCHTSSGRYRFHGEKANQACLPCHRERVENATAHTRHKADSKGNHCISCHMPMTTFARMNRSDHSMRPPCPAAAREFGSPNACNMCHSDRDAAWADAQVRRWHGDDYAGNVLELGRLVQQARTNDWRQLDSMLEYIQDSDHDMIFAASLVRLLANCRDSRKLPALRAALKDAEPLVRSAAARGLGGSSDPVDVFALVEALEDDYRVVRVAAAGALARQPDEMFSPAQRAGIARGFEEYKASLTAYPDMWNGHYNMGNFHVDRGNLREAATSFATAMRLRPDVIPPMVNASMVQARLGDTNGAEALLRKALAVEPANAAANFNLGLAVAEKGHLREAEGYLRAALKADPGMAAAAHNLGILLAKDRPAEAIEMCRRAVALEPGTGRYVYTLAFYLQEDGKAQEAIRVLEKVVAGGGATRECRALLNTLRRRAGTR